MEYLIGRMKTSLHRKLGREGANVINKQPQLQKEAQYSHKVMALMETDESTDAVNRTTVANGDAHTCFPRMFM